MFRLKTKTNGRFPACDRSVLVPRGIFSHRHENLFSWAREFRLFVTSSNRPTGRAEGRRPPQPPPSSFQLPGTPFPFSLYIEQITEASRRWEVDLREVGGSTFAKTDPPCPKRVHSPEPTPGIGMRGRRDRGLQGKRPRSLGQKTAVSWRCSADGAVAASHTRQVSSHYLPVFGKPTTTPPRFSRVHFLFDKLGGKDADVLPAYTRNAPPPAEISAGVWFFGGEGTDFDREERLIFVRQRGVWAARFQKAMLFERPRPSR